jgi:hypothetical protein
MTNSRLLLGQMAIVFLIQASAGGRLARGQKAPPQRGITPSWMADCPPRTHRLGGAEAPSGNPQILGRLGSFYEFIDRVGREDERIQFRIQSGDDPIPQRTDYGRLISIREDEEHAMHWILLDAYHRLDENQKTYKERLEEANGDPVGSCKELADADAKEDAIRTEEGKRKEFILEDAVFKVYRELGEEDFKKVDEFAYKTMGPGRQFPGSITFHHAPYKYAGPPSSPVQP